MYAIVMCGGKGTRIRYHIATEKPMLLLNNRPMVVYVIDALLRSMYFNKILVATSKNTLMTSNFLTNEYLNNGSLDIVDTDGIDYSKDLGFMLEKVKPEMALVVPSDLPLLDSDSITEIINLCNKLNTNSPCVSIVMDKEYIEDLGLAPSIILNIGKRKYSHSGITIFNSSKINTGKESEEIYIIYNSKKIAFNINTRKELLIARKILFNP